MARIYNFTTCGASQQNGPTQTMVNNAYNSDPLLAGKVTSLGGTQEWVVPTTGKYLIETFGAQGGNGYNGSVGGKGTHMKGVFLLTKGTKLRILVGQQPKATLSGSTGGGGGGGTFVTKDDKSPLIISGGGGGGDYRTYNGLDASITAAGVAGRSNSTTGIGGAGGVNGGGGTGGGSYTGGGGGLLTNGTNNGQSNGGGAFANGGTGGVGSYGVGGFGGGGGVQHGGGGGGGYSGGGGGSSNFQGGGGGSYNIGTNAENKLSALTGDGKVVITLQSKLLKVLVKDGSVIKTLRNNVWVDVCPESELTKSHFITDGVEINTIPKARVLELTDDFPELLAYEFDIDGVYDRAQFKPQNLIRVNNVVNDGASFDESLYFFFGEGSKPGDGGHITYNFSEPQVLDRLSVTARLDTFDYKIKDLKLVFTMRNQAGEVTTDTDFIELPNDDSWKGDNNLLINLPKIREGVIRVDVYPDSYWDNVVSGKSSIQFTILQFHRPDDIRYELTTYVGENRMLWATVEGDSSPTLEIPELPITWKSGTQATWKGTPTEYFSITNLGTSMRAKAYDKSGKVISVSPSVAFKPYKWVSFGLPVMDSTSLKVKRAYLHNEHVSVPFPVEHQQVQKNRAYKFMVKNLTKDHIIHDWSELGEHGSSQFSLDFNENGNLLSGGNILRVYLEDELGNGTYEDTHIRKYATEGTTVIDLGVRFSTKALEWDITQPTTSTVKLLFSKDGAIWEKYNFSKNLWETVERENAATEGQHLDEAKALTTKEWLHFEGERLYLMVYMATTDPWTEPKIESIRVNYDSVADTKYFFNVDGEENKWYITDPKTKTWVLIESDLNTARKTHKGNSAAEVMSISPTQWEVFPKGSKLRVGMYLYTNDVTRTPIIKSITLSDVHKASTSVESGELRLFDGYYYSPVLDMEYICQWEKIEYNVTATANHLYTVAVRTHTGKAWTEWAEVTPTTATDLSTVLPEGYKLQFRLYFSTSDKITSPKFLPTAKVTYRISSKEVLDATVQKLSEDLKQTKISLANLEYKQHSTALAQRYNLNNIVIENLNDNSEISVELNAIIEDGVYKLEDNLMDGEIRMTPIELPWFAESVLIHAIYRGDVDYSMSFDGIIYTPVSIHEKLFVPEGATQVHVRARMVSGTVDPEIDFISIMF